MFIPNSRIVSRLADCHLSGYNDETFERLMKEQQSGNAYEEPLKDDKKRRLQECLNDIIENDNDILDTNKTDRKENFKEDLNENIKQYQQMQRIKENEENNQYDNTTGYDFDNEEENEEEKFRRNPYISMRQKPTPRTPREPMRNQQTRNQQLQPRYVNNSFSPYNEHLENINKDLYFAPYLETKQQTERELQQMQPSIYRKGFIYNNDFDRNYKNICIIVIIVCVFIIAFMFMFSVFYCSNNKLNSKIITLENIITETQKDNNKVQPIYIQHPQMQENKQQKYNSYDNVMISPENTVPFSGNN